MKNKKYLFAVIAVIVFLIGKEIYTNPTLRQARAEKGADKYLAANYRSIYRQVEPGAESSPVNYYVVQPETTGKWIEGWWMYYVNPDDKFMYFSIVTDNNGKVYFDGCGEHYLKGGTIYDWYEYEYGKTILAVMKEGFGVENMEYDDIRKENMDGSVRFIAGFDVPVNQNLRRPYDPMLELAGYTGHDGPVLDVTKEYAPWELFSEYGRIFIAFTDDKGGYENGAEERYERYLQVKEWVEKYDIPFKTIMVGKDFDEGLFFHYDEFFDYEFTSDKWSNYVVF